MLTSDTAEQASAGSRRVALDSSLLRGLGASLLLLAFFVCNVAVADVPGLRFVSHPESAVLLPGAEVTLECALNVSADRVEWRHRGEPLPSTAVRSSGRLVVRLALHPAEYNAQTGTYQCVAWFGASALASLPAEIQVAELGPVKAQPQQPLVFSVAPGNVVGITCPPPPSNPPAELHFSKDGQPLSARVSTAGSLLLANVSSSDSGRYTCSASNALTGQTLALPHTVQLKVERPPSGSLPRAPHFLAPRTINYTVLAGSDVSLECPAVGWPPPSMTWTKYGGSLPRERTSMLPGSLVLSTVSRGDEGTYVCEASNGIGSAVSCVLMLHVLEHPSITKEPASMMVEEGGDLHLECEAKGHPTPLISWVQNGEMVEKDPHISTNGPKLHITLVEKRHAGIFQCFATSSLGSAFGLAMLQVQPRPITSRPAYDDADQHSYGVDDLDEGHNGGRGHKQDRGNKKGRRKDRKHKAIMIPPSRPNITRLSDESVMVRWHVSSEEGLPIQFFKVQYRDLTRRGGQWMTIDEDIPPHIRSYEVDNLKTEHPYKFRIAAVYSNNDNKLGTNSARFFLQKEPTTKKPLFPPILTHADAVSPSAIHIEWQYTEVVLVPIEGFFIYYRSTTMAGDYTKATVLGENTRAFLITHLLPDTSYDIKMQSFNMAGTSDFSAIRSYRTQYVPTTPEPGGGSVRSPSIPGGGVLTGMEGSQGGSQQLGLVLGTVLGGLFLLLLLLSLGVYLCRNSNTRTAASEHERAKEVQAYGLTAGKPLTNGGSHHMHQLHRHLGPQRVHITANPLAATDHYKSDGELDASSRNNNCAALLEPVPGLGSPDDSAEEEEEMSEGAMPSAPPRSHSENYV